MARYLAVVDRFKLRTATPAELVSAEQAFAKTAEGQKFLSAPGGPLSTMSGSTEPATIREAELPTVVLDPGYLEQLRRLAAEAPAVISRARAALSTAAPGISSAVPGVTAGHSVTPGPSEDDWAHFLHSAGMGGHPKAAPLGEVFIGGRLPAGSPPATEASLDAFVASLSLGKGGRR